MHLSLQRLPLFFLTFLILGLFRALILSLFMLDLFGSIFYKSYLFRPVQFGVDLCFVFSFGGLSVDLCFVFRSSASTLLLYSWEQDKITNLLVYDKNTRPALLNLHPRLAPPHPARCHLLLCEVWVENHPPATVRGGGKKGGKPPHPVPCTPLLISLKKWHG